MGKSIENKVISLELLDDPGLTRGLTAFSVSIALNNELQAVN